MELLKFNDAPKSVRRGKNPAGFIGAGIMVAVMGLSSTLAGTITIGSGTVEFGQGIVTTAACDTSIVVTPTSKFTSIAGQDTFVVSALSLSDIGVQAGTGSNGAGCAGKVLEIRAYAGDTTPIQFYTDSSTALALVVKIPAASSIVSDNWAAGTYTARSYAVDSNGVIGSVDTYRSGSISAAGSAPAITNSGNAGLTLAITNLSISNSVTKFTVESRAPRTGE